MLVDAVLAGHRGKRFPSDEQPAPVRGELRFTSSARVPTRDGTGSFFVLTLADLLEPGTETLLLPTLRDAYIWKMQGDTFTVAGFAFPALKVKAPDVESRQAWRCTVVR